MTSGRITAGENESPVMLVNSTHTQAFENIMFQIWKKSGGTGRNIWLITRAGQSMDANITSVKSVEHSRAKFLEQIKEWNTNELLCNTSFPKVQKVVFEKQLASEDNHAIAKEWHPQQKRFVDKF